MHELGVQQAAAGPSCSAQPRAALQVSSLGWPSSQRPAQRPFPLPHPTIPHTWKMSAKPEKAASHTRYVSSSISSSCRANVLHLKSMTACAADAGVASVPQQVQQGRRPPSA
jgi:hypothetical protein